MHEVVIVEGEIGEQFLEGHGFHVHGVVVLDELVHQLFEGWVGVERVLVLEALHVKYYMRWETDFCLVGRRGEEIIQKRGQKKPFSKDHWPCLRKTNRDSPSIKQVSSQRRRQHQNRLAPFRRFNFYGKSQVDIVKLITIQPSQIILFLHIPTSQRFYFERWPLNPLNFAIMHRMISFPSPSHLTFCCFILINFIPNKMTEKRAWTEEEDRLLKYLYETSKLTKWSHIARRLQQDYGIKGRNGKQCKERYITHIDTSHPKEEWSYSDQQRLFELHNVLGNKWAIIGSRLESRTDNCVKNHFYSKLRKALKKINKVISQVYRKEIKEIKPNVLYRIVEVVEEKFKEIPKFDKQFSAYSNKLKNELLEFSYDDDVEENDEDNNINAEGAKDLIDKIAEFGVNYKKKTRKSTNLVDQDLLTPTRYHQRVKKCHSENEESQGSSSIVNSSDTSNFEDLSDDDISRTKNSKRSRKNSMESESNTLPVTRIRTRAFSQGNSADTTLQPPTITIHQKPSQKRQQKQQQQLQEQFGELNIFQQQNMPPHPTLMKKQTSKYSRYSDNIIMKEQYHFFDDSQIEMRILPEMMLGEHRESQYEENIFN